MSKRLCLLVLDLETQRDFNEVEGQEPELREVE
jgi:hypothetical protein